MRKLAFFLLLVMLLALPAEFALANSPHAVYTAPEGFKITSYSRHWDAPMLDDLYQELLNNRTGPELLLLTEIIIHPQADRVAAGTYLRRDREWQVGVNIPGFLPPQLNIRRKVGVIELFNGDRRRTVAEMARTLSHEYGHHFTYYHFLGGSREQEYVALRQFDQYPRVGHYHPLGREVYLNNHDWDISEVSAEDYVQLLGSPLARATAPVMDIGEMLQHIIDNPQTSDRSLWENQKYHTLNAANVTPQHNFFLPLAWEVPGLEQWFLALLELEPRHRGELPRPAQPNLTYTSETVPQGRNSYLQYRFSWTAVDSSPDTLYTLVSYDESGYRQPIRSVQGNQNLTALVGTAVINTGIRNYTWSDELLKGTRHFQVYVSYPDGTMTSSEVLTLRFDGPHLPDPASVQILQPNPPQPISVQADKAAGSSQGRLVVNLSFFGEFNSSNRSLARAIAVTNSPEPPDFWSWQPGGEDAVVTITQPGTWYIHYFGQNQGGQIEGTFGPYQVESRTPAWLRRILQFFQY